MKWSQFHNIIISLVLWYIIIILFSAVSHSQDYNGDVDLNIIAKIESNNNPLAYNKRSGCIGLCQINPKGALADWNNSFAIKYRPKDLCNGWINRRIADWYINTRIPLYLKRLHKPDTLDNRLIA